MIFRMLVSALVLFSGVTFAATEEIDQNLRVLSDADTALYTDIFDLQEDGDWRAADALVAKLDNRILMGYVQFQRFMHPTDYRSTFQELKTWMAYYADHPEASKIYSLALKRRTRSETPPARPLPRKWRTAPSHDFHPDLEADYALTSRPRVSQIEGRVRYLTRREEALTALKEIDNHLRTRTITERQYDRMRSWIAASLYYQGYVERADEMATAVAARNGDVAVLSYWIAALIDFRNGDYAAAHDNFSRMAAVDYQEDALRAGAGFWAARAALADGHFDDVTKNLEIAAARPFTFYGQLAMSQLGRDYNYDWTGPVVTLDGIEKLKSRYPAVVRAIALAQVGRDVEADLELRWTNGAIEGHEDYDLMAVAAALRLPAAQVDIALTGDAKYLEAGLYPIPDYEPASGFAVDRAVLYALMRQESKFKLEATSRVGATGLMQLMPRTASYVAKDRSLRTRSGRKKLYDPAINLDIGQDYVSHLIATSANGDLFDMAVAYNGGPGNLRRWKRETNIEDQLLFIESIPNPESRDFVEKVLTNIWVYRARLGQPAPSRDMVASGKTPLYETLDELIGVEAPN